MINKSVPLNSRSQFGALQSQLHRPAQETALPGHPGDTQTLAWEGDGWTQTAQPRGWGARFDRRSGLWARGGARPSPASRRGSLSGGLPGGSSVQEGQVGTSREGRRQENGKSCPGRRHSSCKSPVSE